MILFYVFLDYYGVSEFKSWILYAFLCWESRWVPRYFIIPSGFVVTLDLVEVQYPCVQRLIQYSSAVQRF